MSSVTQVTADFIVENETYKRDIFGASKTIKYNVYGSVKFSNGKLSISIPGRRDMKNVWRVEDKVKAEFANYKTSPIFTNIVETSANIIEDLRVATQELKADYIQKTKETSARIHANAKQNLIIAEAQYDSLYNELKATGVRGFYYNSNLVDLGRTVNKYRAIATASYEAFLATELKHAEMHYETSLVKLATRLMQKGIVGNYTVKSGYVGVNFEVTISSELGTVRAWTIIAFGDIVRPHYRYLIK